MSFETDSDPPDANIPVSSLADRLERLLRAFNATYDRKSPDSMSADQVKALSALSVSISLASIYLVARTSELVGKV
jgi:hypothetical protein